MPIFRSICQTVAYTHSRGYIHRDLKPENILVGTFGEVIILDWGLVQLASEAHQKEPFTEIESAATDLTHPGKIVGTLAYLAPERAFGEPASIQTDLYSLGVILYLILTLQLPFARKSIKEFQKKFSLEKWVDPEEIAPYREVPPLLSRIVKKCLEADPKQRYKSSEELLHDLENYLEGKSSWFETADLDIRRKKDWEFQENLMISKHIAITRSTEEAEWVNIMLSKSPFSENIRMETKVLVEEKGKGIGFLLSVPGASEREHPLEGFCLWLGVEGNEPSSELFRNTVEVMHLPAIYLTPKRWHSITIEKNDNHIHFSLDGIKRFTYLSYLPLMGKYVGILSRDASFRMEPVRIFVGSQNLQVSCLAIPDAFLASKDYKRSLAEYRRIASAFPGHAEGREALFKAGITLLEQAKNAKSEKRAQAFYHLALEEFSKLHSSPGAPLEYLGKSLVYNALRDFHEEIKCLELSLRRYPHHPLIGAIKEQIVYRMHESSQKDRKSAYHLIFTSLKNLPETLHNPETLRLFKHVITHWETLPFIENPIDPSILGKERSPWEANLNRIQFSLPLAFWLAIPYIFYEICDDLFKLSPFDPPSSANFLYILYEVGAFSLFEKWMEKFKERSQSLPEDLQKEMLDNLELLTPLLIAHKNSVEEGCSRFLNLNRKDIGVKEFRSVSSLCQKALVLDQEEWVHTLADSIKDLPLSLEDRIVLDAYRIWAYLKEENYHAAGEIFEAYSLELLNQESTLLHSLYGCFLAATEGEEIAMIHFAGVIDTPFPRSWALLGHELTNKISENPAWMNTSFLWERRRLYRQLSLYYHCVEKPELEGFYRTLERKEYLDAQ